MANFIAISAAELIHYNANSAGRSTGDCVKRSLSLAFDVPYVEMSKELIAKMKEKRSDHWNVQSVYNDVIAAHGGLGPVTLTEPRGTLEEFVDNNCQEGTWLVATGSKPTRSNHIVCVIDGKIYDSWDSSQEYAIRYYTIKNPPKRSFTDININDYQQEIEETVASVGNALIMKYPWYEYLRLFDASYIRYRNNQYKATIKLELKLKPRPYKEETTRYYFDFSVVFTPSTTEEEAHKIIKQTIKIRLYDRLYSVNQQEKKLEEAFEVRGKATSKLDGVWLSTQEQRFLNSLPGRIQGIIEWIDIERPGQYSDSYRVRVTPQHGESEDYIRLYAVDAREMRELIDHYIETGETYLDY